MCEQVDFPKIKQHNLTALKGMRVRPLETSHLIQYAGSEVGSREGTIAMFAAYKPLDRYIGREVRVRAHAREYVGMLAGIYRVEGVPMLVLVPPTGDGVEQHIPLALAVVEIAPE